MKLGLVLLGAVVAVAIVAAIVFTVGTQMFHDRVERLRQQLSADPQPAPATPELPPIVRAYALRAGGTAGGPALFRAEHRASLYQAADRPPLAISAVQWTATRTPGIVWEASGTMSGLPVNVIDAFVSGAGIFEVKLLGTIKVAGGEGTDYDKGELMRYLSELPVYPDAILNAGELKWAQIDERTVSVTARSRSGDAIVQFSFDAAGDIVGLVAADRPMERGGVTIPTPWKGFYSNYRQFGRYRIPAYGEVGWELPDGLFTYWKGEIVAYAPAD